MSLGYRKNIRDAINRPARGQKQDPANAQTIHRIQKVQRANQIILDVDFRIDVAGSRKGCAKKVEDGLHARKRLDKSHPIRKITEMIFDSRQGRAKTFRLAVEDADRMTPVQNVVAQ